MTLYSLAKRKNEIWQQIRWLGRCLNFETWNTFSFSFSLSLNTHTNIYILTHSLWSWLDCSLCFFSRFIRILILLLFFLLLSRLLLQLLFTTLLLFFSLSLLFYSLCFLLVNCVSTSERVREEENKVSRMHFVLCFMRVVRSKRKESIFFYFILHSLDYTS